MLILLPNLLDEGQSEEFLPSVTKSKVQQLHGLIAESEKGGRRYLKRFHVNIPIALCNEHTTDFQELLVPILKNQVWGLISDLGLPCIGDPGSKLVALARKNNIKVEAILGPSAILSALLLSGLEGQRFAFHGYLPREEKELQEKLRHLEKRSHAEQATQIWIEAPYRSSRMLQILLKTLNPETYLCVAKNLSLSTEVVITEKIKVWPPFPLEKEPAVFLIFAKIAGQIDK